MALVLTPELDLIAGISGSVVQGVSTSIENKSVFTAGLWHVNGMTQNLSKFESKFSFSPPSFQNGVEYKAFLGPKISAKIYGILGAYVKPGYAVKLTIAPASDPWLTLKGGLEVSVGLSVTVPVINEDLLSIQLGAINKWWLLLSLSYSSNNQPYSPENPSPPQNTINQSLYTLLYWSGGDPDGDTVVYDVYFEPGNSYPTTKVSDHQSATSFNPGTLMTNTTYFWKVIAFDEHGASTSGIVWRFTTGGGTFNPGEMVLVPAGPFQMGCDPDHNGGISCRGDEFPLHTIYLDAYRIDKYEATNAQYAQCVAAGGCSAPAHNYSYKRSSYYDNPTFASYPVIWVSWADATNYCAWAGKRLPTEAEWEKAARGSSDTRTYPWGEATPTCDLANSHNDYNSTNCIGDTNAVGSYPSGASLYGALDMAGNVWEWVNDWYQSNYYSVSPSTNPPGPTTGSYKVWRGGGWLTDWSGIRVALRGVNQPTSYYDLGFRCAAPILP